MSSGNPNDKMSSTSKWHSRMMKAKSKSVHALNKAKQASFRTSSNGISFSPRYGSSKASEKKDDMNIATKTITTTTTTTSITTTETTKESVDLTNDSNSNKKKEAKNRWSSAVNDAINNPKSSYRTTNKINAMSSSSNESFRPQRTWHGFSSKSRSPNSLLSFNTSSPSTHGYSSNLYKPTSIMTSHSSDSENSDDSDDGESSVVSALSITDTLPGPPRKDNLIMTREVIQQNIINDLRKKCSYYEKMNSSLSKERVALDVQLKAEKVLHKEEVSELRTNLDETKLKLSVLEHHFRSLNEHQEQEDGNEDEEVENEQTGKKPRSIVSLDAAYYNEITASLREKTKRLERIEKEHKELKKKSVDVETELRMDVEDLNQKVEARETTIHSLEESLRKMRESLFAPKALSGRRALLHDDDESSVGTTMTEITFTIPEPQPPPKTYLDLLKNKEMDHEKQMEELTEQMNIRLESKDNLITKLSERLENKSALLQKTRRELKYMKSTKREHSDLIFNLRSLTIMNEMLGASVHKLEGFKIALDAKNSPQAGEHDENVPYSNSNEDQGTEKSMQHILSVAARIELFQEELRIAMRTTELSMKNRLQQIENRAGIDPSSVTENNKIETGQNSFEGTVNEDTVRLEENIKNTHDDCLSALRNMESQLSKRLDEIIDSMQSYEYILCEKQDMIESLEMTCRDNDATISELQHELNKGAKSHRREKSFPKWKSKPSTPSMAKQGDLLVNDAEDLK